MRKKRFIRGRKKSEEMVLQITSMADIFTIILVFLLKGFSTGLASAAPSQEMLLPEGSATPLTKETLKIEINQDAVLVDQQSVLTLDKFAVPNQGVATDGTSDAVYRALMDLRARQKLETTDSNLLVLADQHTPYSTLRPVLAAAANAGFPDLQLVVVGEGE